MGVDWSPESEENRGSLPRSQSVRRSMVWENRSPRVEHSHTMATRQPRVSRSAPLSRSRTMLAPNFASQNSARVAGVVAKRHPGCRCQKQPWTKQTARYPGKTRSGFPGRLAPCRRYLKPRACRALRRSISGRVFLPLMPDIMRERVLGSTMSVMGRFASGSRLFHGPSRWTK